MYRLKWNRRNFAPGDVGQSVETCAKNADGSRLSVAREIHDPMSRAEELAEFDAAQRKTALTPRTARQGGVRTRIVYVDSGCIGRIEVDGVSWRSTKELQAAGYLVLFRPYVPGRDYRVRTVNVDECQSSTSFLQRRSDCDEDKEGD
jgi:hypothetical protein